MSQLDTSFDSELINTTLPEDFRKQNRLILDDWLIQSESDANYENTVKLHQKLAEYYLPENYDKSGLSELYKNMPDYEKSIREIKTNIGGKFYRDHIAHVIRVTLLSVYLQKAIFGDMPANELQWLFVAGLFHDIAYPLQENSGLTKIISESISSNFGSTTTTNSYSFISKKREAAIFSEEIFKTIKTKKIFNNLGNESKILSSFVYGLLKLNHALLSAFELWLLLDSKSKSDHDALSSLLAIALHDPNLFLDKESGVIDADRYPVLFLIVLADELQEWNRWVYSNNQSKVFMSRLEIEGNFDDNFMIFCRYDLEPGTKFSPILQLLSKQKSLSRFQTSKDLNIFFYGMSFKLKSEAEIELGATIEIDLMILEENYKQGIFEIREINNELFLQYSIHNMTDFETADAIRTNNKKEAKEIEFLMPLDKKDILNYQDGKMNVYQNEVNGDILLLISHEENNDLPIKIDEVVFTWFNGELITKIEGIIICKSITFFEENLETYRFDDKFDTVVNRGSVKFSTKTRKTDKMLNQNLSIIFA